MKAIHNIAFFGLSRKNGKSIQGGVSIFVLVFNHESDGFLHVLQQLADGVVSSVKQVEAALLPEDAVHQASLHWPVSSPDALIRFTKAMAKSLLGLN